MRWLKSTTQKSYTALGHVIPKCIPDNNYLKVSEEEFAQLMAIAVIKSLVNAGGILVTAVEPSELRNSIEGLTSSNAELIAKNTQLEERVKELEAAGGDTSAVEEIKSQAIKELQEKQDALDAAQAEIARLKEQLERSYEE